MKNFNKLKNFLFLILFFKADGFTFRYPMEIFYDEKFKFVDLLDKWSSFNYTKDRLQLYIHSIYCDTKCNYCDCRSLLRNKKTNDFIKYKDYIIKRINDYGKVINKSINSIYFGGGTFNLLSNKQIKEIYGELLNNFSLSNNYIWQVEIHPYYLNKNTLKILKSFGVTDIMLGIQTINKNINKLHNRKFNQNKINFAISEIINLGFRKVSFDILYNLPYMKIEDTINDLEYIYKIGNKLKQKGIKVNLEINRWDISLRAGFPLIFLNKYGKKRFFDICLYYIKNSEKLVKIVDRYIDYKFLGLFDTDREEIEERKINNTAILGIGLSANSYIPGNVVYEDMSYRFWKKDIFLYKGYSLKEIDNELFFISDNIRRGINYDLFKKTLEKSNKLKIFYNFYKNIFKINKVGDIYIDVNSDIENDILNLFLIKENLINKQYNYLLNKWYECGFTDNDFLKYKDVFLNYYYNRNKLYG